MTVTRCAEILIARRGGWMAMAGIQTSPSPPPPQVMDAISWAIAALGKSVADPLSPNDGEIASAGGPQKVADVAEYRLLASIRGHFTRVDASAGPVSEKWSQLLKEIGEEMERVGRYLKDKYGVFEENVHADVGVIDLNVSERL